MQRRFKYFALLAAFSLVVQPFAQTHHMNQGSIRFMSSAKLENIKASSPSLKGAVDFTKQTFAFSIDVNTFEGFNSALQAEHFRENYMETPEFPKATFVGKLIDPVNTNVGKQKVRAKGVLSIHGVNKDRIIDVELTRQGSGYGMTSTFHVALDDHSIVIPKLVHQKIAETITVTVEGKLVE
jgi:polyisoprenoid-binding protein YceI